MKVGQLNTLTINKTWCLIWKVRVIRRGGTGECHLMEHFFACNGAIGGMCITENSIARFDGSWKISRASMDKYQSSTPRQGNRSHPIMSHDLRQQDYPPQSLEIPSR